MSRTNYSVVFKAHNTSSSLTLSKISVSATQLVCGCHSSPCCKSETFSLTVMEVSCGEYGDKVPELVVAAKTGLCRQFQSSLSPLNGRIEKKETTGDSAIIGSKTRMSRTSLTPSVRWSTAVLDNLMRSLPDIDHMRETDILDDGCEEIKESDIRETVIEGATKV